LFQLNRHFVGVTKELMNPPPGYEKKFADFIRLCSDAKAKGATQVTVACPWVLGDNYEELIESLSRLADGGLFHFRSIPPWFGIHCMFRTPARRARMASRLAFLAPNFRTENHFRRTTYGSGLQVAFQYVRGRVDRRSTSFCTPTMPDELLRLRISAHQRRNICLGGPNFASNFR
jgi:hypothetical protein